MALVEKAIESSDWKEVEQRLENISDQDFVEEIKTVKIGSKDAGKTVPWLLLSQRENLRKDLFINVFNRALKLGVSGKELNAVPKAGDDEGRSILWMLLHTEDLESFKSLFSQLINQDDIDVDADINSIAQVADHDDGEHLYENASVLLLLADKKEWKLVEQLIDKGVDTSIEAINKIVALGLDVWSHVSVLSLMLEDGQLHLAKKILAPLLDLTVDSAPPAKRARPSFGL